MMSNKFADEDFTTWAFGSIDKCTLLERTPAMWNSLHSDIFWCLGNSDLFKNLDIMYDAYMKHKEDN